MSPVKTNKRQKKQKFPRQPPPSQRPFHHDWVEGKWTPRAAKHSPGTVEAHAIEMQISQHQFDCAKAQFKWPQGAELSEYDFMKAILAVDNASVR